MGFVTIAQLPIQPSQRRKKNVIFAPTIILQMNVVINAQKHYPLHKFQYQNAKVFVMEPLKSMKTVLASVLKIRFQLKTDA